MSLDNLLKAKQEGEKRLPWKDLSKEDFKKYYSLFHEGKSKPRMKEDDLRFYDALKERGFLNYIFPVSGQLKIPLDSRMESFAKDYVNTITPVNEIADRYYLKQLRNNIHLDRYMKKAIGLGYIKKEEYEKAVERRQFLNLTGKYFSPELQSKLFEIASKGYDYIKENQQKIADDVVSDFLRHKKNGDENRWLKTNIYFSNKYGRATYSRPIGRKHFTTIISKNEKTKKIQDERRRIISHLIWFFKIFTPGKHRYHSSK
jgi:hypothetical protein